MTEQKTQVKESKKSDLEREYIIPLRRKWKHVPRYKRASKAVKSVKEFLARHMKVRDRDLKKIKIDKLLNEAIWSRGIKKPLNKVKVKVIREGEIIKAELAELPEKLKFKKARLDKREAQAMEIAKKKKQEEKSLVEKLKEGTRPSVAESEKTEEQKKEETEKKAAVVEAGKELEKAAAKQAKHQVKVSKQPKHQRRKALAK